jgi:hypothetical protein
MLPKPISLTSNTIIKKHLTLGSDLDSVKILMLRGFHRKPAPVSFLFYHKQLSARKKGKIRILLTKTASPIS